MISRDTLEQYPVLESNGPAFRKSDPGPETKLVEEFLRRWLPVLNGDQAVQVLREPRIEAEFPDLVIAFWDKEVASAWPTTRLQLQIDDFRILQGLRSIGLSGEQRISTYLGCEPHDSLHRLHEAGLIYRASSSWGLRSLSAVFALRRLIAIEAKVDDWSTGLKQSARNRWFAGESYLLLGQNYVPERLRDLSAAMGVGLLQQDTSLAEPAVEARNMDLPRSYATWLLNEWVWQAQLDANSGKGASTHAA